MIRLPPLEPGERVLWWSRGGRGWLGWTMVLLLGFVGGSLLAALVLGVTNPPGYMGPVIFVLLLAGTFWLAIRKSAVPSVAVTDRHLILAYGKGRATRVRLDAITRVAVGHVAVRATEPHAPVSQATGAVHVAHRLPSGGEDVIVAKPRRELPNLVKLLEDLTSKRLDPERLPGIPHRRFEAESSTVFVAEVVDHGINTWPIGPLVVGPTRVVLLGTRRSAGTARPRDRRELGRGLRAMMSEGRSAQEIEHHALYLAEQLRDHDGALVLSRDDVRLESSGRRLRIHGAESAPGAGGYDGLRLSRRDAPRFAG